VRDPQVFQLLDVACDMFNNHLIDLKAILKSQEANDDATETLEGQWPPSGGGSHRHIVARLQAWPRPRRARAIVNLLRDEFGWGSPAPTVARWCGPNPMTYGMRRLGPSESSGGVVADA